MILLKNDLMTISYATESGVLEVVYGDLYLLPVQVIKDQIGKTMQVIAGHAVTKVLYDSSNTVSPASPEESKEISAFLFDNLKQTAVEKVARLQSPRFITDTTVRSSFEALAALNKPGFQFESFINRDEALEWLSGWESMSMT